MRKAVEFDDRLSASPHLPAMQGTNQALCSGKASQKYTATRGPFPTTRQPRRANYSHLLSLGTRRPREPRPFVGRVTHTEGLLVYAAAQLDDRRQRIWGRDGPEHASFR